VNMRRGKKFETSRNYRVEKKTLKINAFQNWVKEDSFGACAFHSGPWNGWFRWFILFFVVKISQTLSNITHFVGSEIPAVRSRVWVFLGICFLCFTCVLHSGIQFFLPSSISSCIRPRVVALVSIQLKRPLTRTFCSSCWTE
jgi:hypothetical protein